MLLRTESIEEAKDAAAELDQLTDQQDDVSRFCSSNTSPTLKELSSTFQKYEPYLCLNVYIMRSRNFILLYYRYNVFSMENLNHVATVARLSNALSSSEGEFCLLRALLLVEELLFKTNLEADTFR